MATLTTRLSLSKPASTDLVSAFQSSVGTSFDTIDADILASQGAYAAGTTYHAFDIVSSNGTYYMSTATQTGAAPPGANWQPLTVATNANNTTDVTLDTANYTTVLTTGSLTVGVWLLIANVTISNGNATAGTAEITAAVGTATATFAGQQSGEGELPALSGGTLQLGLGTLVTVTAAGTIIVQAKAPGVAASTAKGTTPTSSSAKASGFTAVKVG